MVMMPRKPAGWEITLIVPIDDETPETFVPYGAVQGWNPNGVLGDVANMGREHSTLGFVMDDPQRRDAGVEPDAPDDLTSSHGGSIAGKIWNAPNSIIGAGLGTLGYVAGLPLHWLGLQEKPDILFGNNAAQFTNSPFIGKDAAITLGNVEVYGPVERGGGRDNLGPHEEQHTYQGEQLGPLYLPSNILGGLAAELIDGYWHGPHNWNEIGPQQPSPVPWPK
ncbi:MAG TPA: hypothetical protein VJS47_00475 [Rhizomicrobium sp.]|nr:hypothetical protein [Rhizomicrobium sp.]